MINKAFNNNKYNISFGLNAQNKEAISHLHQDLEDRTSVIQSFDMEDPDIGPCLDEFSHQVTENPSDIKEMSAILDKLGILGIKIGNKTRLEECLSTFIDYWSKLFLSTRLKAISLMDTVGMNHPNMGHLSRTATNPIYKDTAMRNIKKADKYIKENVKKNVCPDKNLLVNLHKIITKDINFEADNDIIYDYTDYSGIIEGSEEDKILLDGEIQTYEVRLNKFMTWLKNNYEKNDIFLLAAQSYKKLLGISPFYDGNGRTIRAFIDALLYSKGYRLKSYPSNYTEARNMKMDDVRMLFENNCEKIPN